MMNGFVQVYYRVSEWIMRLAYVNMLWVIFTLLGLGVLGIMPATAGMFSVIRKWVLQKDDIKVFPTFWKTYKKEFFKTNLLGIVFFSIGYIFSIELHILRSSDQLMHMTASFVVILLIIFLVIILLYFFPIYVHFNLRIIDYIKWSFIIGIIHPILTIVLIIGLSLIFYAAYSTIPALLIFFGGSVPAYLMMSSISKTFDKFEETNSEAVNI